MGVPSSEKHFLKPPYPKARLKLLLRAMQPIAVPLIPALPSFPSRCQVDFLCLPLDYKFLEGKDQILSDEPFLSTAPGTEPVL